MLQKTTCYLIGLILIVGLSSATLNYYAPLHAKTAPTGYTGATGTYCNSQCHTTNMLNQAGGSIAVTGVPANFVASQSYKFSITIKHGVSDRKKFGFAVIAVNADGVPVGSFSSANQYATPNGSELVSSSPPALSVATNTYTYDNLTWTAPATTSGSNANITFYYVGNATNYNMSTSGDYVYAGTARSVATLSTLPVQMTDFTLSSQGNNVLLRWVTAQEDNTHHFVVERSTDGRHFSAMGQVRASSHSDMPRTYSFTDSVKSSLQGPIFYRVVTVDIDGQRSLSPIRTIQLQFAATMVRSYFPNPINAGKELQVELVCQKQGAALVKLINQEGGVLMQLKYDVERGLNRITIPVPYTSSPGLLTAVIAADGQTQQLPLLINRQ